ncbi:putative beta-glucosidase G [Paramyrothecium foliicola]|nr:putative beta-glucosidase G [Paramyrothecium foliicola]
MEATVRGLQVAGVQPNPKHFILKEQEIRRKARYFSNGTIEFESISSVVGDRTLQLQLRNGILEKKLGFQGYVVSGWYMVYSGVASIEVRLDRDMPGYLEYGSGLLPELGRWSSYFEGNIKAFNNVTIDEAQRDNMHAAASTALLKTINNAFPLKAPRLNANFGNNAGDVTEGQYARDDFEYGAPAIGGGSGAVRFTYLVTLLDAIRRRAGQDGALVQHWLNNIRIATSNVTSLWRAKAHEACVVFLKAWGHEGIRREWLDLQSDTNQVVEKVAKDCNNITVVTQAAGVTTLPFSDHPAVTAVLVAHYPGQESSNSIVDVLYGYVNPSGRAYLSVRYEFGYGLLYTTFDISDIATRKNLTDDATARPPKREVAPRGNPDLWEKFFEVDINVRITGTIRREARLLYMSFERTTVTFEFMRRAISYLDIISQDWVVPNGEITVSVGWSSRDPVQKATIKALNCFDKLVVPA